MAHFQRVAFGMALLLAGPTMAMRTSAADAGAGTAIEGRVSELVPWAQRLENSARAANDNVRREELYKLMHQLMKHVDRIAAGARDGAIALRGGYADAELETSLREMRQSANAARESASGLGLEIQRITGTRVEDPLPGLLNSRGGNLIIALGEFKRDPLLAADRLDQVAEDAEAVRRHLQRTTLVLFTPRPGPAPRK
jgi:hypothetical protein